MRTVRRVWHTRSKKNRTRPQICTRRKKRRHRERRNNSRPKRKRGTQKTRREGGQRESYLVESGGDRNRTAVMTPAVKKRGDYEETPEGG